MTRNLSSPNIHQRNPHQSYCVMFQCVAFRGEVQHSGRSGIICYHRNGNREIQPEQEQNVGQTLIWDRSGEGRSRGVEIEDQATALRTIINTSRCLHPLSLEHQLILPLCGILYPRTYPLIFVRSASSSECIRCALFNLLGWQIEAGHFTVIAHFGVVPTRCERAGKGGSASLLPDRGLFACCGMWTTWGMGLMIDL
jgi:hypothetical protein